MDTSLATALKRGAEACDSERGNGKCARRFWRFHYRRVSLIGGTVGEEKLKGDLSLPKEHCRKLFYFPIVHTMEDLGSLAESARAESVRQVGRVGWKRKSEAVDRIWTEIEKAVERLLRSIPCDKVRVYQDGLPVCGREDELVAELAKKGSRNHGLILRLMRRGATVMGTESPDLLIKEYERAKGSFVRSSIRSKPTREESESSSLLQRRDRFIAGRINDTLREGEIGLIFLGMLHSLDTLLDQDIEVLYPMRQPETVQGSC